jgi:hypothetical protein
VSAKPESALHGLLAEFDQAALVVEAAGKVYAAGYRKLDAYTPYPLEALAEALQLGRSVMSKLTLGGALVGFGAGYGLCYWTSVIDYPLNIAGKPFHSWPAFVVPTYETTILFACLTAVFGMLAVNGLPRLYHPVFNVPSFTLGASRDKFFICIEAEDERFDVAETRRFLEALPGVRAVNEVPR